MENPWAENQKLGDCDKKEHLDVITNAEGKFAQCMPIIGVNGYNNCPPPPKFDTTKLDSFAVDLKDHGKTRACVVECSNAARGDCPKNSTCMDAPEIFQSERVKKICYYKQPKPVMENPWDGDKKNGDCDKLEHLDVQTNASGKFAQCMPIIGATGYNQCPPPPKFDTTMLNAFAVDLKDLGIKACVVECSVASEGDCPKHSACMDAPEIFKSANVKKIC